MSAEIFFRLFRFAGSAASGLEHMLTKVKTKEQKINHQYICMYGYPAIHAVYSVWHKQKCYTTKLKSHN